MHDMYSLQTAAYMRLRGCLAAGQGTVSRWPVLLQPAQQNVCELQLLRTGPRMSWACSLLCPACCRLDDHELPVCGATL
jgi:hypothetical protein